MALLLKKALAECGISQWRLAKQLGKSRMAVNRWLNTGDQYWLTEGHVLAWAAGPNGLRVVEWAKRKRLNIEDLLTIQISAGYISPGLTNPRPPKPTRMELLDDPWIIRKEHATMITLQAMKHFKLKRNPWANDVNSSDDIFLSSDHLFLREMILETAKWNGFAAIYGEVGSGKSVMRKSVYHGLTADGIKIIFPRVLDKSRITASMLLDAIVMDLSAGKVCRALEARTRQAIDLLTARARSGQRQVLIIEEGHLLNTAALKYLKQIYEFEDGFRRLVGVIVIGQPELAGKLNEHEHPELREVIRRLTVAEITGLSRDDCRRYIEHKLNRAGTNAAAVFDPDAYPAIFKRLELDNGQGTTSGAYPLSINRVCATAMLAATELGEPLVSAEIVYQS